jgi:RNA polymerase sigma-70 factor (ECF subfamily)
VGLRSSAPVDLGAAYRKYGHVVLRRARLILGNNAEAEDALQEVFATLANRPEQFHGGAALLTFLYSTTTHHCLNRLRNEKTRARLRAEHIAPYANERAEPSLDDARFLREFLRDLPRELAEVAVAYFGDEMTHDEIAKQMGCSPRHIGNLVDRLKEHARGKELTPCPT